MLVNRLLCPLLVEIYFQTANGVLPSGSNTMTVEHTNTHITQNNTTKSKQNKDKQISSQSYTNTEGYITAIECSIEKQEK
jgi:hypothetical protein